LTIIVGVVPLHDIDGDIIDIITIPSTFTYFNNVVTVTEDWFNIWTVGSSPFIFTHDNTVVDFTSVEGSVVIGITVF
jgi:hypothetical protein